MEPICYCVTGKGLDGSPLNVEETFGAVSSLMNPRIAWGAGEVEELVTGQLDDSSEGFLAPGRRRTRRQGKRAGPSDISFSSNHSGGQPSCWSPGKLRVASSRRAGYQPNYG